MAGTLTPKASGKGSLAGNDSLSTSSKVVRQYAAQGAAGMPHRGTFKNASPASKATPNMKTAPTGLKAGLPKSDQGKGTYKGTGAQLGGAK